MATDRGSSQGIMKSQTVFFLSVLFCVSSSSATSQSSSSSSSSSSKPHIIFILADDLGWYDVSWHNPKAITPNLESLAKDGILLEQSYVQPTCTPTRSALLTGRYPFTIGRQGSVIGAQSPTGLLLNATLLPQSLKEVGYSTHAVGKWHLGFCQWDYTPTYRGFDTFYGYYLGMGDHFTHNSAHFGGHTEPIAFDFRNNTEPDFSVNGTYDTYVYSSYVENLLHVRNPEEPLFLYLAFQTVHEPTQVPDTYREPFQYIGDETREILLGMSWAMDEAVGVVVDALKATDHYDNSIIIFTSDVRYVDSSSVSGITTSKNGGQRNVGNNWPLRGSKGSLWEGGTRAAGFIHSPLLTKKGVTSNTLFHVTDWYPTLMGLVGGSAPENTDGFDMWEALTLETESPRTSMIYNINNVTQDDNTTETEAALRKGDYKLIVGSPGEGSWIVPPEGVDDGAERFSRSQGDNLSLRISTSRSRDRSNDASAGTSAGADGYDTRDRINIKLFDVVADPEERDNLADSYPEIVDDILKDLQVEILRMVPADNPPSDPDADPKYFGDVWSPGWC